MQRLRIKYNYHVVALIFLILSQLGVSSCRNEFTRRNMPKAVKGILDLTDWNWVKDGPVKLKGEWAFYWQQHLYPKEISKPSAPQITGFMRLPEYWNTYKIDGKKISGEGFATFYLKVLLNSNKEPLALKVMEISTAYALFVNGKKIASAGIPGYNRETTSPEQYPQIVDFENVRDQLEIIIHVSNFHHKKGGVWEAIQLGVEKQMRQSQENKLGFDLFLFGSIVIMGLYHLGLFAVRRIDRSPLYFSLFCFLIALRLLTTGERFLIHMYPSISWDVVIRLEYLSFYLVVPAFILFIRSLFPKFSKRILYTIGALGVGFSIIVVSTHARFYSQMTNWYQIITLLTIIYSLYVIFISLVQKRLEAVVFLLGFAVLALMTINDILYVEGMIETGLFVPFGVLVFIFSQAWLLSFRFSNALATVESQDRELRSAFEAMRLSEEKHRTILNTIEEGYFEVDNDGILSFFNDSFCVISGHRRDELIGMKLQEVIGEDTADQIHQAFAEFNRTGKTPKSFSWESIRKDGEKKYIETSVSAMLNSENQPIGLRGVARDVTEGKNAEEQSKIHQQQLMHASKMVALGTLVSGVAHEINNPNNFIMINSPILKDAWENILPILENYYEENGDFVIRGMNYSEMRKNIPELCSGIAEGSKRIKQIVEDLKNYVRDDTADLTQTVDLNEVLNSAVTLVSNMIKKSTNHFDIDFDKDLPLLKGNFQRLEQVAINLIQNACQALTSADKKISLSTLFEPEKSTITICFRDEGTGIGPETLSQITDPFYTTKQKSGGVGLGLSISSRIIEEHGGSIQFESQIGIGTVVNVILPINR